MLTSEAAFFLLVSSSAFHIFPNLPHCPGSSLHGLVKLDNQVINALIDCPLTGITIFFVNYFGGILSVKYFMFLKTAV